MTRSELLDRISSRELTEWMAFYELEPWGTEIQFAGHAITASTVANVNRPKGTKAFRAEDFMPKFSKKPQTVDDMINFAAMLTAGLGGQDLREDTNDDSDESVSEVVS